jgi:hypothetical protein
MSVVTYEGTVEDGRIRINSDVLLPEKTKVYVVVPDNQNAAPRIISPRLAHQEQVADFMMEIVEDQSDAGI